MTEPGENRGLRVNRTPVDVRPGGYVMHHGKTYRITDIIDFNGAIGIDVETGHSKPLPIRELEPAGDTEQTGSQAVDIDCIGDKDWKVAKERYAAIKPLLETPCRTRDDVRARAREVGKSDNTLYRWMRSYISAGNLSALVPMKRGWKKGSSRISPEIEAIIEEAINDTYLTVQRPTAQKVVLEVRRRCMERKLVPPNHNTVRARIAKVSERKRLRKWGHAEKANNKFQPAVGHFPHADYPLAVTQIDHTPLDITVVDDIYRLPIGRPWLTLAMDIYSRVVTGYYLAFDSPSGLSVAMCVSHSILPKEAWLDLHDIDAEWPIWGIMDKIYVDNGPDFRAENFRRSCEMYGINLEFRPVKRPKFGGHIERLLGTFLKELHNLPGTTFSNVKERDGYDSEKHACMTLSELEKWLVTFICKVYHERYHSGIGMSPLKKWEIGIFGNAEVTGRGLPSRLPDGNKIFLDFLPAYHRTVQTYGVAIEGIKYYADVLRPWINALEPGSPDTKRKFVFRRDPRSIKTIWFFDPEIKEYFPIPFANQALPDMSIWEYRKAREHLKKTGGDINEHEVMRAVTELREQVEEAASRTRKARRKRQRQRHHARKITPANPVPAKLPEPEAPIQSDFLPDSELLDDDILGYEDIA